MKRGRKPAEDADLEATFEKLVEAFGTFFERFGFKRNFGRLWMVLYLSPEPLDQATLGVRLGMSTGLVSATLRELDHWGAITKRSGTRGKNLYSAEERLLKTVVSILKKREAPAVRNILDVVSTALEVLTVGSRAAPNQLRIERLRNVQKVGRLYEVLVAFVEALSRGPTALVEQGERIVSGFRGLLKRARG